MSFTSQDYLRSLDKHRYAQMMRTHMPSGTHPDTGDRFLIPTILRYSGTIINGLPGNGKTRLMMNMILHDAFIGHSVIVLDPHGDLTTDCIARLPEEMINRVFVLDMEDIKHPFGLNILSSPGFKKAQAIAQTQAVDRVMHVWELLWPDILGQAYLPRFLRAATITLFSNPGSTLLDLRRLLVDNPFRRKLLRAVEDPTVLEFWERFDELSATQQRQQIDPLIGRLESLFMGRSIVRNIIGQETSIDFRKAIEEEIIFIKFPLTTLPQDAKLIGTIIIALIHAAIFSFSDMLESDRPGFSLYIDECQNFATPDLGQMFTEGRKFGVRVCLAHQYRKQLPESLRQATSMAATKICFQTSHDDAMEMSHYFASGETYMKPEDIDPEPIDHLLKYGSDNLNVQIFIDRYLRPLQSQRHGGKVEIKYPGFQAGHMFYWAVGMQAPIKPVLTSDPTPYLNHLLYQVMKTGEFHHFIQAQVFYGFSNMGRGFYSTFLYDWNKAKLLRGDVTYPSYLVVSGRWTREPETNKEQLYHFLFHLQETMKHLSQNPIGKKSVHSPQEIASDLTRLPKRAAYVRSGTDVGVIYTDDSPPAIDGDELWGRICLVQSFTRNKYCKPVEASRDINTPNQPNEQTNTNTNVDDENQPPFSGWEEVE